MASAGGDPKESVKIPAIALLVTGCLYVMGGLGCCGTGIYGWTITASRPMGTSSEYQERYETNVKLGASGYGASGFFGLLASGVIIYGALQMMRLKSYRLAMTSSILAMIPCHICCFAGLPIGIWALIVLMKPEVKSAFS
jgi:hypothetical protein